MTWLLIAIVAVLVPVLFLAFSLIEKCLKHITTLANRVAELQAGRGTLTALCCDIERQVHVLQNRVDNLHHTVVCHTREPDEHFTPDTDMEDE